MTISSENISGSSRWHAKFPWLGCPGSSLNNFKPKFSGLQQNTWKLTDLTAAVSQQECWETDGVRNSTLAASKYHLHRKPGRLGLDDCAKATCLPLEIQSKTTRWIFTRLRKEETTITYLDIFFRKVLLDFGENCSTEHISKETFCCIK